MTLGTAKPGVEIALRKNDHRGRKGHAEDHRRGRAQESLRRGVGHGQVDPRLEDTVDIQLLVAQIAAFGEEIASLDAMKHELRERAKRFPLYPGAVHFRVNVELSEVVHSPVLYFIVLNVDMVKMLLSPYFGSATALA